MVKVRSWDPVTLFYIYMVLVKQSNGKKRQLTHFCVIHDFGWQQVNYIIQRVFWVGADERQLEVICRGCWIHEAVWWTTTSSEITMKCYHQIFWLKKGNSQHQSQPTFPTLCLMAGGDFRGSQTVFRAEHQPHNVLHESVLMKGKSMYQHSHI